MFLRQISEQNLSDKALLNNTLILFRLVARMLFPISSASGKFFFSKMRLSRKNESFFPYWKFCFAAAIERFYSFHTVPESIKVCSRNNLAH